MLKLIPEEQFTYVHGSCSTVGVGGYLLGGGSNVAGPPMRYGSGAENVLEYTMVTAEGDIVKVDKDGVTKTDYEGNAVWRRLKLYSLQAVVAKKSLVLFTTTRSLRCPVVARTTCSTL